MSFGNSNHLYVVEICFETERSWSLQLDLIYEHPTRKVLQQVEGANPGMKARWVLFQRQYFNFDDFERKLK